MQQQMYENTEEGLDQFISDARKVLNLNDLCKDKKIKALKKKTELFSEGDTPLNIYFVKSGSIKVYQAHPDGKELITNIYNANDFFGFEAIIEGDNYHEYAEAMQDAEIISIPRQDFLTLLQSHPDVSRSFIALLCKKVKEKEKQLVTLAYNSVRQRTAQALLKIRDLNDKRDAIQISREDLAKIVGTAPESVIRVLSDFKEEKLIEIDQGKIKIVQPAKLEKVVRWNVAL
jgi:CRP-like cAMP-binding protein